MPALSYKGGFVEYVEAGLRPKPKKGERVKRQTIRNPRKHLIKVGDKLHHYFGMRTKWCRKIGESICKSVLPITINHHAVIIGLRGEKGSKFLETIDELNAFAYADGFGITGDPSDAWETMRRWWTLTHGANCFPFHGQLIQW